ncbi:hypothetical protein CCMA1212_007206 [Trichoderma ghanense]|uniref:Uncharacterized protein n=1 Tax=Trichoderma ghanense TaxID=65468 RepID=A0ABY2GXD8_9HYPO
MNERKREWQRGNHLHNQRLALLNALPLDNLILQNLARHRRRYRGRRLLEPQRLLVPRWRQQRQVRLDAVLENGQLGLRVRLLRDDGGLDALAGESRLELRHGAGDGRLADDVVEDFRLGGGGAVLVVVVVAGDGDGVDVVARLGDGGLDDFALVLAVAVEDLEGEAALAGGVCVAEAEGEAVRAGAGGVLLGLVDEDAEGGLGEDLVVDGAGLEELVAPLVDEARLDVAGDEGLGGAHALEELDVCAQADNLKGAQGGGELGNGRLAGVAADDELGDHAVVGLGHDAAGAEAPVQADVGIVLGGVQQHGVDELARVRHEALLGVLGVDAGLDGGAALAHALLDLGLRQRQLLAGGDAELPLDQVQAGDHLGDGVLDLQARVHLHEVELAAVLVEDELDRAGADVAHGLGGLARLVPEVLPGRLVEVGRGRLLEHLLVPPLDAAVALAQGDGVAVLVGEDLDLDVARAHNVLFDEHDLAALAKRRPGLGSGALELRHELVLLHDDAHALAAASPHALEEHGEGDFLCVRQQLRLALLRAVVPGHAGHVGGVHNLLAPGLVAHVGHGRGGRADEDDALLLASLDELVVLGQEAVARVQRLDAVLLGQGDYLLAVEVAVGRAEGERLEAGGCVPRVGVDVGVHGGGPDAHALRGAVDAQGDFASVGDEHGAEERWLGERGGGGGRGSRGGCREESRDGPQGEALGSEGTHGGLRDGQGAGLYKRETQEELEKSNDKEELAPLKRNWRWFVPDSPGPNQRSPCRGFSRVDAR